MQKQKGKTATMVSGAEEMWTDGVSDWWGGVAQPPMNASQPIRAGKKELAMHKKVSKKKLVWVMSIGRNRL